MLNIAICDDENTICNQLEDILYNVTTRYNIKINIDIFFNAESLYEKLNHNAHYNLIFLDIELGNMSGVDLGRKIREDMNNQSTQIIYISSKTSYAMELFSVRPLNFLIKPLTTEKVDKVFNIFLNLINTSVELFTYNKNKKEYSFLISDIIYFESDTRQINIYTKDEIDTFYGGLKEIHKKLKDFGFIFIHRSYLININQVKVFKYDKVTLLDETIINISQTYRKNVRDIQMKMGDI